MKKSASLCDLPVAANKTQSSSSNKDDGAGSGSKQRFGALRLADELPVTASRSASVDVPSGANTAPKTFDRILSFTKKKKDSGGRK
jgi:hypothetical protein